MATIASHLISLLQLLNVDKRKVDGEVTGGNWFVIKLKEENMGCFVWVRVRLRLPINQGLKYYSKIRKIICENNLMSSKQKTVLCKSYRERFIVLRKALLSKCKTMFSGCIW